MFGIALSVATYIPAVAKVLATKAGNAIVAVIVTLLLVLAFAA